MLLTADTVTHFNNMHLCIPLQIKKKSNEANDIDDGLMTLNSFFAHFVTGIDIRRYGNDIRILPTNNTVDIYRHSDAMLKHMADDALKTYDITLLYIKKTVKLANNIDRRPNNTSNSRTDNNLDDRIDKFHDLLGKKKIFPVGIRYWSDISFLLVLHRDIDQLRIEIEVISFSNSIMML